LKRSNTHRRMPATSRTKNEHTHYFERSISYSVNEDFIPLDNQRGGDQNYETFVELTDSGYFAVSKKFDDGQEITDIFRLYLTEDQGWQSKFLFSLNRRVFKMAVDKDRFILDHEVYDMFGSLIQSLLFKFAENAMISADVAKGLFGGILAIEENMIVCGYQVHGKFQLFRWNGMKYIEYMRCRLKKCGETKHFIVTNLKKSKFAKY
jgi:hypothetical protein